jgi:hypothetical protein
MNYVNTAYRYYQKYLSTWSELVKTGNGTSDLRKRPGVYAILDDNTTVTAPWIEMEYNNMTDLFETYGRIIVNVSLAMPHIGVMDAALHPVNEVIQPKDLDGIGTYHIRASVPSPVIQVTCAMLTKEDLRPLVSDLWDNSFPANSSDVYLGGTPLDAIFAWGEEYGRYTWPPVFERLPIGYNTMINDTLGLPFGRQSIYLLGNSTVPHTPSAASSDSSTDTSIYPLCQLKVRQTPYCSTLYHASLERGTLAAHCEDDTDSMAYIKSFANATAGNHTIKNDWPSIGGQLLKST